MSAPSGESLTSGFTSTTGGVMTVEAGAVTGELEISTGPTDGGLAVKVRYTGAEEWYTVEGAPIPAGLLDPSATPRDRHRRIVEHLRSAAPAVAGNEEPTSLADYGARTG